MNGKKNVATRYNRDTYSSTKSYDPCREGPSLQAAENINSNVATRYNRDTYSSTKSYDPCREGPSLQAAENINSDKMTSQLPTKKAGIKTSWDRFGVRETIEERLDVDNYCSFKLIRLIMYVVLFVVFLASLVTQKLSLAIASTKLPTERQKNENKVTNSSQPLTIHSSETTTHSLLLLTAMCIPYVLNFLSSCWKVHFGNSKRPSISSIVMCIVLAVCQSVGLCLLVFNLLPNVGPIQGLLVLSATGIIPSLLKLPHTLKKSNSHQQTTNKKRNSLPKKIFIFSVDVLALLLQMSVGALIFIPDVKFFCRISTLHGNKVHTPNGDIITECINGFGSCFMALFAIFLASFAWWENFLESLKEKKNGDQIRLKGLISDIQSDLNENRAYINIFVSLFKILVSFVLTNFIAKCQLYDPEIWTELAEQSFHDVLDIILLVLSSIVCYCIACLACKLQMQIFSFAIPCLLSTPIASGIMTYLCLRRGDFLSRNFNFDCDSDCDINYLNSNYYLVPASLWILSLYWTAGHIWFPKQKRIATIESLFVNPFYCGILLEQDLVLNRKRDQDKVQTQEDKKTFDKDNIPMVYACATMWHESRMEMKQLLKSLFRMDKDQAKRGKQYPDDFYRFEVHIFFDDAYKDNGCVNEFITELNSVIDEATSKRNSERIDLEGPYKFPTCYGEQRVYKMPEGNFMYIHLKDKTKIRRKKRWSQVMYLYYLLGYRLQMEKEYMEKEYMQRKDNNVDIDDLFKMKAENTFILALDGDVDFTPGAVRILIDRMKKDKTVGAVCGRIHSIGNGPIVWYQKFEYAIAHWLQKATEHVLGCVLCSPGCFSLFRGSALMDTNVMGKYVQVPTNAIEVLMYDLGEDRWLCTLLLQQGYRVDYAAAADAFTNAPEGFNEFFQQRKRWGPSTLANIMALLQNWEKVVKENPNISWLYIIYLGSLMVSTIIGPSTILMLIAGAFVTVFDISIVNAYIASVIPGVLFFVICLVCTTKVQLIVAQVLSGFYVIIMMVVMVGLLITALTQSPYHPSVIFLLGLVLIFVVAAVLHPREWVNILYGFLYFVSIPSGFLVQVIYSLCNLNDVSWGTRENSTPGKEKIKENGVLSNIFSPVSKLVNNSFRRDSSDKEKLFLNLLQETISMLGHKNQSADSVSKCDLPSGDVADQPPKDENSTHEKDAQTTPKSNNSKCWIDEGPFQGEKLTMNENESKFWQDLVERYLDPKDVKMKKDLTGELKELRNNVCSGMALVNILWITVNFMFQFRSPTVVTFQLPIEDYGDEHGIYEMKIEMLGLLFIIFFLVLLLIQFCGMVMHRLGTFIHLVAVTDPLKPIRPPKNESGQSIEISTLRQIQQLQEYGTRYISTPSSSEINSNSEQTEELRHEQSQPNLRHRLSKSETSNQTSKLSEH